MTTVAWDGKTLAVDRQVTIDGNVRGKCCKLFKIKKGKWLTGAGDLYELKQIADWMSGTMEEEPPQVNETEFVMIDTIKKKVLFFDKRMTPVEIEPPVSLGSGSQFALAGMKMKLDAISAIRLAAQSDIFTGSGVEFITVDGKLGKIEE